MLPPAPQEKPGLEVPAALLSRFRPLGCLGRGGMGAVFLAEDLALGRQVALKLMRDPGDPEGRRRFLREAGRIAALDHPNIVGTFDQGQVGDVLFLVQEYLIGEDLDRGSGPFDPLDPMLQIASALDAVHGADLVHRDLKPANIVRTDQGRAVLIDFGLVHDPRSTRITRTGALLGTPAFLDPALLRSPGSTPPNDWWGWGVTLFYLEEGRYPFEVGALLASSSGAPLPPLQFRALDPTGPRARLLRAVLDQDPDRRPASSREVADLLGTEDEGPEDVDAQYELPPEERGSTSAWAPGLTREGRFTTLVDRQAVTREILVPVGSGSAPETPASPRPPRALAREQLSSPAGQRARVLHLADLPGTTPLRSWLWWRSLLSLLLGALVLQWTTLPPAPEKLPPVQEARAATPRRAAPPPSRTRPPRARRSSPRPAPRVPEPPVRPVARTSLYRKPSVIGARVRHRDRLAKLLTPGSRSVMSLLPFEPHLLRSRAAFQAAKEARDAGEWQRCLAAVLKARRAGFPTAPLVELLASSFLKLESPREALLELAVEHRDDLRLPGPLLLMAGMAHELQGDLEAARDAYEALVELQPESASGYSHLARVFSRAGNHSAALERAYRARELDPGLSGPLRDMLWDSSLNQATGKIVHQILRDSKYERLTDAGIEDSVDRLAGLLRLDEASTSAERVDDMAHYLIWGGTEEEEDEEDW